MELKITEQSVEAVFKEWQRRDKECDDELRVDIKDSDYPKSCSNYFVELHDELFPEGIPK